MTHNPQRLRHARTEGAGSAGAKGFQPIENYGVIGNMRSIALVSIEGSIDFLCFPDFDSPTIFAALLDAERGGSFALNPDLEDMRIKQLYLPDTNILLTRFLSESGLAEVTDFMPVVEDKDKQRYGHHIIRMLRVIKWQISFKMHCAPRFNYARTGHKAQPDQGSICFIPDCPDWPSMALHATFPLHVDGADAKAAFTLNAGETAMIAFGEVDEEEKASAVVLDPDNVFVFDAAGRLVASPGAM